MKRIVIVIAASIFWLTGIFGSLVNASGSQDDFVKTKLDAMTVEQKVGQIMIGYFNGPVLSPELADKIQNMHMGGVILYGVTGNIESTRQVVKLTGDIQKTAVDAGEIPLFISIDQEGGRVTRITNGMTVFPGNMSLGAAGDAKLASQAAAVMARELKILGINLNFAPDIDVNSNPDNPIIGTRSFGSSPAEVARLGIAVIDAYNEEGIISTAKHFPGHGDTSVDSHLGLPIVNRSLQQLNTVELAPFRAVASKVPVIMTAHIVLPAIDSEHPATLSPKALEMLREDVGFEGLIITDSLGMGAIAKNWSLEEAAIQAFLAGADILLYGADRESKVEDQVVVYEALVQAVNDGRISSARLDDSVRRILATKRQFGILTEPMPKSELYSELASPKSLAVAEQVALQSITLVKNENHLLPLAKRQTPIIWPEEMKAALQPLLAECPSLRPYFIPLQATKADREAIKKVVAEEKAVLIGSYNLHQNIAWRQLISSLDFKRAFVLSVRSPYDIIHIPYTAGYAVSYDDNAVTMKVLGKVLNGQLQPKGRLPVDIPNMYSRGWGLDLNSAEAEVQK